MGALKRWWTSGPTPISYSSLPAEQLVALWRDRAQLTPEALAALTVEAGRRGLVLEQRQQRPPRQPLGRVPHHEATVAAAPAPIDLGHVVELTRAVGQALGHVEAFREAVQTEPTNLPARLNLGRSLTTLGRDVDAAAVYTEGLAIAGGRADEAATLHFHRANCWLRQGDLSQARGDLEAALRLKPDWLDPRFTLAVVCVREGRVDQLGVLRDELEEGGFNPDLLAGLP